MTQRLPEPPDPLPDLTDDHVVVVPPGTPLMRWHDLGGDHPRAHDEPRYFGPLAHKGRFDHHPTPTADHEPHHGVSYVALDPPRADGPARGLTSPDTLDVVCCEVVQDGDVIVVTPGDTLTVLRTSGSLRLLNVRGPWAQLTRAGTHLSTAPHQQTQRWARAIRAAYPHLHGLLYVPPTGGRSCAAALNESAVRLLSGPVDLSRRIVDDEMLDILDAVAHRLGFAIELVR